MGPFITPGSLWWDREADDQGTPLRADVRQAAKVFWPDACLRTRNTLGEEHQAVELLETSAARLAQELNQRQATLFHEDVSSQLSLYFAQELARCAAKLGIKQRKRSRYGFGLQEQDHHPTATRNLLELPAANDNSGLSLLEKHGCWLDRGTIDGIVIRDDVRCAAEQAFALARRETHGAMKDAEEAAALMERAVVEACQYLDEKKQEPSIPRAQALLMKIFRRLLMRRAKRLNRQQPASRTVEIKAVVRQWDDPIIASLTLEKIEGCLSPEAFNIWVLIRAEYDWDEIAGMFGTTVTAIKKRFWREIKHAKTRLGIKPKKAGEEGAAARRRR